MTVLFNNFFESKYKPFILLLLPCLLLYSNALMFDFSPLDDQWLIVENEWFISDWSNIKAAFTGSTAIQIYYHPLLVVTTFLDYHIGKLDPFTYHLTNILLHATCAILLNIFLIQCKTSKQMAFWLSLIFSVHPVLLHAVVWIPGRNDSMLCLFVLASLICLNKFAVGSKISFFILHILFFICALLIKETVINICSIRINREIFV